jgi:ATP:corrinoid adenosyltransferase
MLEVGDRVRVETSKLGQAVREGVVTDVLGQLLRVRWSTGEESTFTPGPGSVTVVGKARVRANKTASSKKGAAASTKQTAKKVVAKTKVVPKKHR